MKGIEDIKSDLNWLVRCTEPRTKLTPPAGMDPEINDWI